VWRQTEKTSSPEQWVQQALPWQRASPAQHCCHPVQLAGLAFCTQLDNHVVDDEQAREPCVTVTSRSFCCIAAVFPHVRLVYV
jgi:hypothetical protein